MAEACRCCAIASDPSTPGGVHAVGRCWTLNANVDQHARPLFVLQVQAHRASLAALSESEARELGAILRRLPEAITAETGAQRVHVLYLNESATHAHFHLVPRFAGDPPGIVGHALMNQAPPHPQPPAAELTSRIAARLGAEAGPVAESHAIVLALLAPVRVWQRYASLYTWLDRLWKRADFRRSALASIYVPGWLFILALALALSESGSDVLVALSAGIAAYRYVDLAAFHIRLILSRGERMLAGIERSVALLGLNLVELSLIVAVWVQVATSAGVGDSWMDAFRITTLTGEPAAHGDGMALIQVAGTVAALILIAGGLGMLIGIIGSRFAEKPSGD